MSIKIDINDYRDFRVEGKDWGKEIGAIIIECDDPAVEKAILNLLTTASNVYSVSGDMMFSGNRWRGDKESNRMQVFAFGVETTPEDLEETRGLKKVVRA